MGSAMACKTHNLNITKPQQVITKVLPFPNQQDKSVNAFLVHNQNCEYFPNISDFFGNIEGIAIQKSNLRKITKKDLKGFKNLKSISLFGNRLKIIENELFRYNPKLELVSLFNNQLQPIFPSAFDNIINLKILYLNSNPCINQDALQSSDIEKIKCEIVSKCKVDEQLREFAEIESQSMKFSEENEKLQASFDSLNRNFVSIKRDLERYRDGYER